LDWLEISIQVDDENAVEAISSLFDRYGHGGTVQERTFTNGSSRNPLTLKTYLPLDDACREKRKALAQGLGDLGRVCPLPAARFEVLAEDDWANAWRTWFQPQRIGRHLVIKLPDQRFSPHEDDIVIDLEPGMAFGTGLHQTTRMCLAHLEERLRPGDRVLDMGTGSGILAVAAARLGAANVLALDTDPVAVGVAQDNVSLNGLEGAIEVERGSVAYLTGACHPLFDGIVVNILADVIAGMMAQGLTGYLKLHGWLIAGGIVEESEPIVQGAFTEVGMQVSARSQAEDWVTLSAEKVAGAVSSGVEGQGAESERQEA
jgi:ribosomal protein L11 methyltransferase